MPQNHSLHNIRGLQIFLLLTNLLFLFSISFSTYAYTLTHPLSVSQACTMTRLPATPPPPIIISELSFSSTNLCHPTYAIDTDIISLSFTTSKPLFLHNHLWNSQLLQIISLDSSNTHWNITWQVSSNTLLDGQILTATDWLNAIFSKDEYVINSTNGRASIQQSIQYFAPIEVEAISFTPHTSWQCMNLNSALSPLYLQVNHPVSIVSSTIHTESTPTYLTSEQESMQAQYIYSFSIIDAAGNGPLYYHN